MVRWAATVLVRASVRQYDFEAISPTRTRLTLTTRYKARTPINAYARAWGNLLLGDIHTNVLHVVRQRAEREANADEAAERLPWIGIIAPSPLGL